MVWRQWVRCTATLRFAVDEAAPMVDLYDGLGIRYRGRCELVGVGSATPHSSVFSVHHTGT